MHKLEIKQLKRSVPDELSERVIFQDINFTVSTGDIVFIKGPSGIGKSLLLRSIASLDRLQAGDILLDGEPPKRIGEPLFRSRVAYVPQARVQGLKGSPSELYFKAQNFKAQSGRDRSDLPQLISQLGLPQTVLNQQWSEFSGGEAQRVLLAIHVALKPEFLLVDEPTSNLDPETTLLVEQVLKAASRTCGILWVSHEPSQLLRVGGKVLELPLGNLSLLSDEEFGTR